MLFWLPDHHSRTPLLHPHSESSGGTYRWIQFHVCITWSTMLESLEPRLFNFHRKENLLKILNGKNNFFLLRLLWIIWVHSQCFLLSFFPLLFPVTCHLPRPKHTQKLSTHWGGSHIQSICCFREKSFQWLYIILYVLLLSIESMLKSLRKLFSFEENSEKRNCFLYKKD